MPTDDPHGDNPYSPPAAATLKVEGRIAGEAREQLLRAFVGSKADKYFRKWQRYLAGQATDAGFNFAAFFFTVLWLVYRKMYKAAAILTAVIVVEAMAEELVFVTLLDRPSPPPAISLAVTVFIAVACGMLGNIWYLKHAQAAIEKVQTETSSHLEQMQVLEARGSTSATAVLVYLTVGIGLAVATVLLEELLVGLA